MATSLAMLTARSRWVAALCLLLAAWAAYAQDPPQAQRDPVEELRLRVEQIDQSLADVRAARDLPAPTADEAAEAYERALEHLARAQAALARAEQDAQAEQQAPRRREEIRQQIRQTTRPVEPQIPPDVPLRELEAQLSDLRAQRRQAVQEYLRLQNEQQEREAQRRRFPSRRIELLTRLPQIRAEITQIDTEAQEHPRVIEARRSALQAEARAIQAEMQALSARQDRYAAEEELLAARTDLARLRQRQYEELLGGWESHVRQRRREEVLARAQESISQAAGIPALEQLARENRELAMRQLEIQDLRVQPDQQVVQFWQQIFQIRTQFQTLQQRIEATGLTSAVGLRMRQRRAELPSLTSHRRELRQRQEVIADVQVEQFRLQEQRGELAHLEPRVREIVQQIDPPPAQVDDVADRARQMLLAQRELIDALLSEYNAYFARLMDLDEAQRRLISEVDEFASFIDENILWIRSTRALRAQDLPDAVPAVRWLARPGHWLEVLRALEADARTNWLAVGLSLVALLLLLAPQAYLRGRLASLGENVARRRTDTLSLPVVALVLTLLIALALPVAIWFVSWRLTESPLATVFTEAVAAGLLAVAVTLATIRLLTVTARPLGLGEVHFRWPAKTLTSLRLRMRLLLMVAVPLAFVVTVIEAQPEPHYKDTLGRLLLIGGLVSAAVFLSRLLRPTGPVIEPLLARGSDSLTYRLRFLWYMGTVTPPLVLAAMSAAGYGYTAVLLGLRLLGTLWLILGLIFLRALLQRWLVILLRRAARRRASARTQQAQLAGPPAPPTPTDELATDAVPPPAPEPEVDLARINQRARQMLRYVSLLVLVIGIYAVWVDALPALGVLRDVTVWRSVTQVADGPDVVSRVTLAHIGMTFLIVLLTFLAVRNTPALLEFAILQRVQVEPGVRYAVKNLIVYTIAVIGIIVAFGALGVSWQSIQWLVAAVTVGLGFGLQEIFANFVSGLIILFERPVRIGDVITVGETSGTVTRIRIRATTITDWDRKELIVPNKEFVTGRLVNWSLSDRLLRVIVRVGIAYGSDTEQAEQILRRVANEHPSVLKEPPPSVLFNSFGDDALGFELRMFIPGIDHFLRVTHDIHMMVDREFRKAGISIAFPQRDVHLNSVSPIQVQLVDPRTGAKIDPPPPAADTPGS